MIPAGSVPTTVTYHRSRGAHFAPTLGSDKPHTPGDPVRYRCDPPTVRSDREQQARGFNLRPWEDANRM